MEKLQLAWENTLDTPLNSNRLAKNVDKISKENLLYFDNAEFLTYKGLNPALADNKLKLAPNVQIALEYQQTSALFNFDNSLLSHNSKKGPILFENIEYTFENNKSYIGFQEASTNLINNPSFENDFTNWTTSIDGASQLNINTDIVKYGNKSAQFIIDSSGNQVSIEQDVDVNSNNIVSISFYMKGKGYYYIQTEIGGLIKYWGNNNWQSILSSDLAIGSLNYNESDNFIRIEIPNIDVSVTDFIKIVVYNNIPNEVTYIDAFQVEELNYCSIYTDTSHGLTKLQYPFNLIDNKQGSIDLGIIIKEFNSDFNYIVNLSPMILLTYNAITEQFQYTFTDNSSNTKTITVNLSKNDIQNKYLRIILTWNYNVGTGLYIYLDNTIYQNFESWTFDLVNTSILTKIDIGGNYDISNNITNILKGLIDFIQFNTIFIFSQQIENLFNQEIKPFDNLYYLFESPNYSIELNKEYLDGDTDFIVNTNYNVFLCYDKQSDEAEIKISRFNLLTNYTEYNSRLIGGFKIDNSGNIISDSIWDINQYYNGQKLKIDKFLYKNLFELNGLPYKDHDQLNINLPTTINGIVDITGNTTINGTTQLDNFIFSGNTLTNNNSITENFGTTNRNINGDYNLNVNNNIIITSTSGTIKNYVNSLLATEILQNGDLIIYKNIKMIQGNDLAEIWFMGRHKNNLKYNKVIIQTEKGPKLSYKRADKRVVGVISDSYSMLLGIKNNTKIDLKKGLIPVAIAGRVKVLYKGKIKIGDELVSYKNGLAVKANFFEKIFKRNAIIGKVDKIIDEKICWIKIY